MLDASAAVEFVLGSRRGRIVSERITPVHESVHAPHLIDLEVAQALRRAASGAQASSDRLRTALEDFRAIRLERYPHDVFLPRIWELRHNTSAYDAVYLALSEILAAPLLTCDSALVNVPGCEAEVVCV